MIVMMAKNITWPNLALNPIGFLSSLAIALLATKPNSVHQEAD
jgi:hypothetical protein